MIIYKNGLLLFIKVLVQNCDIVFAEEVLDDKEFTDYYNKYNNDRDTNKVELKKKIML